MLDGIYLGISGVYCLGGPIVMTATQLNPESQFLLRLPELTKRSLNKKKHWQQVMSILDSDLIKTQCVKTITVEEQRHAKAANLIKIGLLGASIQVQLKTGLNKIYAPPYFLITSTTSHLEVCPYDPLYNCVSMWLARRQRFGLMKQLALKFPQYLLERNLGRSVPSHQLAVLEYGPNPGVHPSPESFNIGLWIYSLLRQDYREVLPYIRYLTQPPDWWSKHNLNKIPLDWLSIKQRHELPMLIEKVTNRDILARRKRTSFQTYFSSIQLPTEFSQWIQQHPPTDNTLS